MDIIEFEENYKSINNHNQKRRERQQDEDNDSDDEDNYSDDDDDDEEDEIITYTDCDKCLSIISIFFEELQRIIIENGNIHFPSINNLILVLLNTKAKDLLSFSHTSKIENFSLVRYLICKGVKLDPLFYETIITIKFDSIWIYVQDGKVELDLPIYFKCKSTKLLEYLSQVIQN